MKIKIILFLLAVYTANIVCMETVIANSTSQPDCRMYSIKCSSCNLSFEDRTKANTHTKKCGTHAKVVFTMAKQITQPSKSLPELPHSKAHENQAIPEASINRQQLQDITYFIQCSACRAYFTTVIAACIHTNDEKECKKKKASIVHTLNSATLTLLASKNKK